MLQMSILEGFIHSLNNNNNYYNKSVICTLNLRFLILYNFDESVSGIDGVIEDRGGGDVGEGERCEGG